MFRPTIVCVYALLAGLLVVHAPASAERCPKTGQKTGVWSKLAFVVCEDAKHDMHLRMPSPDGKKLLFAEGREPDGVLFVESLGKSGRKMFGATRPGAETLWSPTSSAIAETMCFGARGPCKVWISPSDEDAPPEEAWDPTRMIVEAFSVGHENDICYTQANVGALAWDDGSDRVVLIAEVQCRGDKDGYFEGFVVSLSERKILARLSMAQTVERWRRLLGTGLVSDIKLVREETAEAERK